MTRAQLPTAARLAALTNQQGTDATAHHYGVHPKTIQRALRHAGYRWQPQTGWTNDNPTTAADDPDAPPATFTYQPLDWHDQAACAQIGHWPFFPDRGHEEDAHTARRICAHCPVQPECLNWALDTAQQHGIWGGTTPRQRQRLRPHPAEEPATP